MAFILFNNTSKSEYSSRINTLQCDIVLNPILYTQCVSICGWQNTLQTQFMYVIIIIQIHVEQRMNDIAYSI